jgi:hypothetical protein
VTGPKTATRPRTERDDRRGQAADSGVPGPLPQAGRWSGCTQPMAGATYRVTFSSSWAL